MADHDEPRDEKAYKVMPEEAKHERGFELLLGEISRDVKHIAENGYKYLAMADIS